MLKKKIQQTLAIYQAKNGAIELKGDIGAQTLWATQAQIGRAFEVDVNTIIEHIGNIYKTKELTKTATTRKFRVVQKEGNRSVERDIQHYNLDMILSVGYRVNSKRATTFRQWATKTLRQYILEGYVIDRKKIAKNYEAFLEAVDAVKKVFSYYFSAGQEIGWFSLN